MLNYETNTYNLNIFSDINTSLDLLKSEQKTKKPEQASNSATRKRAKEIEEGCTPS